VITKSKKGGGGGLSVSKGRRSERRELTSLGRVMMVGLDDGETDCGRLSN
jgi:hypothetical protein